MAKPEATFISYINKRINTDIYKQSMYTPYSGGTPDNYYEATNLTLWIEYKFEHKMPKIYRLSEKLSPLQLRWLNRAYENGQNVAVVVGFGKHDVVVFIDQAWIYNYTEAELREHIISRQQFIKDLDDYMAGTARILGGMQ